jgi:hypothetical protein
VAIILLLACVPLFIHLPYRVNIFLSWEGAYRMSKGQLPFRDFGTPLGGMYWVIPAIFFKLFGAQLFTLVKAQVFINIISGLSFRSILRSLSVNKMIRLASVILFCLSYSFFNFWPWYNHSVIVFELVALAFLLQYLCPDKTGEGPARERPAGERHAGERHAGERAASAGAVGERPGKGGTAAGWLWLSGAAFFVVCSFLTKQDGGGLALLVACGMLAAHGVLTGKWMPLLIFGGSLIVLLFLVILPFLPYGFGYWFNHGQAPHSSRVSGFDIATEFFGSSQWIKFYFFVIVLLALVRYRSLTMLKADPAGAMLLVLTLGMLAEAAILQVTSYTPPDNNIFFHSFAFACLLSLLAPLLPVSLDRPGLALVLVCGILLWWSGVWWKYTGRLSAGPAVAAAAAPKGGENVVNKDNYMINRDTTKDIPTEQWVQCGLPAFHKITMPAPTADGIHRLMETDLVKNGKGQLRVLNMSELTPLAVEIPYTLEKNGRLPLWYHLGVGMFNRQADTFETRIRQRYYDLVLFEYLPTLNNFYPFRVRDSLRLHYRQVDSFMAPRRGVETKGTIEVYMR